MVVARRKWLLVGLLGVVSLWGCTAGISGKPSITPTVGKYPAPAYTQVLPTEPFTAAPTTPPVNPTEEVNLDPTSTPIAKIASPSSDVEILSLNVTGEQGAYNYSVTIRSPDEGCSQYADWWEVISQEGELFYRRILLHSHADEQPFTRSGGPVPIDAETIVLVRAHMHPSGYGGLAMKGSVVGGFEPIELSEDFAADLVETPPLPEGCGF
jgi:hypothetical protein